MLKIQKTLLITTLLLFAGKTLGYAQALITYTKNFPKSNAVVTVTQKRDSSAYLIVINHNGMNDTIHDMLNKPNFNNIINLINFDFVDKIYFSTVSYNVSYDALTYITYKISDHHYSRHKVTMLYLNHNGHLISSKKKIYKHRIIDMKNIITYTKGEPEIHWTFDPRRGELVKKE